MAEEPQDAEKVETETTPESSTEDQQPTEEAQTEETTVEEPVDEKEVPIKNRVAEANRKLKKAEKLSQSQAQKALLSPNKETPSGDPAQDDEAIKIVQDIAKKEATGEIMKHLEPVLVRQFLYENPDAADYVEDINRIRDQHPELKSVDKLEIAYKIAKAERQDELLRKAEEKGQAELLEKQQKSNQATITGTGKSKSEPISLADQINQAETPEELDKLVAGL